MSHSFSASISRNDNPTSEIHARGPPQMDSSTDSHCDNLDSVLLGDVPDDLRSDCLFHRNHPLERDLPLGLGMGRRLENQQAYEKKSSGIGHPVLGASVSRSFSA